MRPVLTKEELWPPCRRCGSDGYPADFEGGSPDDEYLCYYCRPGWIREALEGRPQKMEEILQFHIDSFDEIMELREDPTCFSYRGYGRMGEES